jgi:CRP/FNR family cyclic AMP-dependent transcriptional regulator
MTLAERMQALQQGTMFNSVPKADLVVLAESMYEESFDEDEVVCVHGEPADRIFLVVTGNLDVKVAGGIDHAISLGTGDLFGEYGLFDQGIRTASITAREPSILLTLEYPRFRAFLVLFPEAMLAILSSTVEQLLTFQRKQGMSG